MSETARAASRRRVHGVARWARDLPLSSGAHLLVVVVMTLPSYPGTHRDVQGSLVLKEAGPPDTVLHGATVNHVAAPFHAAFLGLWVSGVHVAAHGETARVFEEGFLEVALCAC